jgi:hypothetical protein
MNLSSAKRKLTSFSRNWWDRQEDDSDKGVSWSMGDYFRKRVDDREFVTPEIDSWDKSDIKSFNRTVVQRLKQENPEMSDAIDEAASKIPEYFQYNLHNMYLNPPDIRKIEEVSDKNKWQMNLLEHMDNYYMKGVTYNSKLNSTIFTSEIMGQMVMKAALREDKDTEEMLKQMGGGGKGDGEVSNNDQGDISKAMDEAEKRSEDMMDELADANDLGVDGELDESKEGGKNAGSQSGELTVQTAQQILAMKKMLNATTLPKEGIMNFIKEVIKRGTSYFSSQYTVHEEELLESESDDLLNVEDLLPIYQMLNLDDIVVQEREYHMGFDVYVDMSGSMSTRIPLTPDGSKHKKADMDYVTAYTLSKVAALKMDQLGLVNDFYLFDNRVVPMGRNKKKFIKTSSGGGTTIDNVLRNIAATGNPSIVITDAGDHISVVETNAYFLTIAGGRLNTYGDLANGHNYYTHKQVSAFEGGKFHVPADIDDHNKFISENGQGYRYW